jgi:TonB family protein
MLTRTRLLLLLLALTAICGHAAARTSDVLRFMLNAAATATDATDTDRDRDGLSGPVRRIRTETAKVLVKEGKIVEGPRVVLETATYDMKGVKIDNAYFLAAGGSLTGKEVYKYDDKGNIVEMTLFNADGSVMSKEVYQYEFDAMGNWTKMVTSVAIVENSKLTFEPTEVTYRSISYFLEENVARKLQPGASAAPAQTAAAPSSAQAQPLTVVKTAANVPVAPSVKLNNAASLPTTTLSTNANVTLSAPVNAANVGAGGAATAVVKTDDGPPPPSNVYRAPVKPVSGGVLNGRAVTMPSPEYPEPAKRMRASGLVSVEVVVDVTGRVISAKATSGHITLRAAAEQAAMRARFSPTLLSGQPVKVAGIINYNFAF